MNNSRNSMRFGRDRVAPRRKPTLGKSNRGRLSLPLSTVIMNKIFTRRSFLKILTSAFLIPHLQETPTPAPATGPNDWNQETDLARSIREYLEGAFQGHEMALD